MTWAEKCKKHRFCGAFLDLFFFLDGKQGEDQKSENSAENQSECKL